MSYIKGVNTTCAKVDCCEKEPEALITLESATFKIKATGTEVVINKDDIDKSRVTYYWDEIASSSCVTEVIINELAKTL